MSNEISNERLEDIMNGSQANNLATVRPRSPEIRQMARELLALRKAFSVPDCWEIAGQIFATEEEALSYGYIGKPEPLYSRPD